MPAWTDQLRFAFQPVVNLATGSIAALEILARPEDGGTDVLGSAHRCPDLDAELAALAVRAAAHQETMLPLHVNVFAATVAELPSLTSLGKAVRDVGRRPWEITLDIGGPFTHVPHRSLREAVAGLRDEGYRICADGVGDGDLPLRLLGELAPDLVKLDRSLCAGLAADRGRRAAVAAMRQLCEQVGGLLAIEGVETERQYAAVREAGVQLAQGHLFAPPARRASAEVYLPPDRPPAARGPAPYSPPSGPPVAQFLQPAALLPMSASAGAVRSHLTGFPGVSGVLLVDTDGVPVRAIDRDRFLLSLSGRYGHALYADRPALRLADRPRTVGADATAWEVLDVIADGERDRTGDDVAVVDERGRCMGVVHLADILRALAESRVEEAARLNPLTRLPGSDAVNGEVDRRIAEGRAFALSWLDVDGFKQVNDGAGFAAGDELIRSVGRALAEVAAREPSSRVGHIGGDDFLVLAGPEGPTPFAEAVLDVPWSAGGRPVTLSLATVDCPPGSVRSHGEAAAALAPLKKAAKALPGASWVVGRPGSAGTEVRRGAMARVPSPAAPAGPTCAGTAGAEGVRICP
ncbi:GGDEF domain-containing protein [Streptomyces chattanoogensis]|uniref:Diguanylate cyclase (GGDEF) domain-containing protein n=1 Tax=Streptomyces chattanoogensis TaxID=66876 RepID=A0A0N0XS28_9ACTN|nr:GGDEF domain-containing protein [Streptomyces chattanoogensis]KPC60145.1 diguanylate cyclase (GGDEF) domain-containing protein [Streptomyces chattanoogensis]